MKVIMIMYVTENSFGQTVTTRSVPSVLCDFIRILTIFEILAGQKKIAEFFGTL